MAISYAEASVIIKAVAVKLQSKSRLQPSEEIPLSQASGRITAREYVSPLATPAFDSSAMDGFAVVSDTTRQASQDNPAIFRVRACMVAGDPATCTTSSPGKDGLNPCIEIMTGARFPLVPADVKNFDAVIKVEDVTEFDCETENDRVRCIKVVKPVAQNHNKRFAGSDFGNGESVLRANETVRPHHIMAMASLGFKSIEVWKKVKVGLWSTGRELALPLQNSRWNSHITDANGPYLEAALRDSGAEVDFLGVLDDDESAFMSILRQQAQSGRYSILITTGAVSKGKLDFIPSGLKSVGADTRFHGVSMRPGHPVIFATLPIHSLSHPSTEHRSCYQGGNLERTSMEEIAFFGLPGNPIATAACLRFIVMPYIHTLLGMRHEAGIKATVVEIENNSQVAIQASKLDYFKHGFLSAESSTSGWTVQISTDQSPAKLRPFAAANCWCHLRSDEVELRVGAVVDCFLL